MNLTGPDLDKLAEFGERLKNGLKARGGLTDLDTSLSLRKPEVRVSIDREAASDLGVQVVTIADSLRILVGGLPVTNFRDGGEQYDVWLRAKAGERASLDDIYDMTVPSPKAGNVKVASFANLNEETRAHRNRTSQPRTHRHRPRKPRIHRRSAPPSPAPSKMLEQMDLPPATPTSSQARPKPSARPATTSPSPSSSRSSSCT